MEEIEFVKAQALGNDFILINQLSREKDFSPQTVKRLCNRHFGIGSDGLILVRSSTNGDFQMLFYNPDGTTAQMCGNGIRCFGKYLYDHGFTKKTNLLVETPSGLKELHLRLAGKKIVETEVDMGVPIFATSEIPMIAETKEFINNSLSVGKRKVRVTCLSMGNPHCVIFVDDIEETPVSSLGPLIENLSFFPQRINVEFVEVPNNSEVKVRVWERGAGETLACGTGACAAVVAAVKNGYTKRKVKVTLAGGVLEINWDYNNHVYLAGPAEEVFEGRIKVEDG